MKAFTCKISKKEAQNYQIETQNKLKEIKMTTEKHKTSINELKMTQPFRRTISVTTRFLNNNLNNLKDLYNIPTDQ